LAFLFFFYFEHTDEDYSRKVLCAINWILMFLSVSVWVRCSIPAGL